MGGYNRPRDDGSGQFDVFATRIGCDGAVRVQPVRLDAADDANHVDPAVAASSDRALIAWHRDDGQYPYNLSIHRAVVGADGGIITPGEALDLAFDGAPHEGNAWMPAVAPLPDGAFAVAGARGHEAYNSFQTFVQRVDAGGDPTEDTVDVAAVVAASWALDGDGLQGGRVEDIDVGDGAPPYAPAITHVVEDVWFVAWSEGANPDYRVRGRFVDLAD